MSSLQPVCVCVIVLLLELVICVFSVSLVQRHEQETPGTLDSSTYLHHFKSESCFIIKK